MANQDELEKYQQFVKEKELPGNDSGRGPESSLPAELKGLNWGALCLNLAWGIPMRVHIAWLCIVPFIGFFIPFVLWIKGNEWAWANRKWKSNEHFRHVQDRWAFWGFIFLAIFILLNIAIMSWVESLFQQYMPNVVI